MVFKRSKILTSPLIQSNYNFLHELSNTRSPERRKHLIYNASREQILALVEVALNLLRGRVPIHSYQKRRIGNQASAIRQLSRVRNEKSARKILLASEQRGAGPLAIAGLISRLLLPFITELIV